MLTCTELLSLAALLSVCRASTKESCISSIAEFERIAVRENVENQREIHRSFYSVNRPSPLSVQVVYHVNSTNGTNTFISTDPNCPPGKEMWLWIPSPIFIFVEPTKLNEYALRAMNYFTQWKPRKAHIFVPDICGNEKDRFNLINEMTSRVSCVLSSGCILHPIIVVRVLVSKINTTYTIHLYRYRATPSADTIWSRDTC